MDPRAKLIGMNEALFRDVNERVDEINRDFGAFAGAEFVCECGSAECADRIPLSFDEYRRVRKDATTFFVKPGHELPDVETVIEQHEDYNVVRKHAGDPARLATELDPRR